MLIQAKDIPVALMLMMAAGLSFYTKKLTLSAAFTGFICAFLIYLGAGYTGVILMTVFFISGTMATTWGRNQKKHMARHDDSPRRNYAQVLANGGAATLMALLILLFPVYKTMFLVMLAASLASATADTLSSELGMLYGRKFYNCISFKKDKRGLDGVISLEGTVIGLAGAVVIGAICVLNYKAEQAVAITTVHFLIIVLSGILGNFCDSVLGATLERKNLISNDAVNLFSTLFAAILAGLFYVIFLLF